MHRGLVAADGARELALHRVKQARKLLFVGIRVGLQLAAVGGGVLSQLRARLRVLIAEIRLLLAAERAEPLRVLLELSGKGLSLLLKQCSLLLLIPAERAVPCSEGARLLRAYSVQCSLLLGLGSRDELGKQRVGFLLDQLQPRVHQALEGVHVLESRVLHVRLQR